MRVYEILSGVRAPEAFSIAGIVHHQAYSLRAGEEAKLYLRGSWPSDDIRGSNKR